MMADCLTKASAKPDALLKAVNSGRIPNVDKHPPFREVMQGKHKAYKSTAHWTVNNLEDAGSVSTFLGERVFDEIQYLMSAVRRCGDYY